MATTIDYAVLAGRAYQTTRAPLNWFPLPDEWLEYFHVPNNPDFPQFKAATGFEAISFQNKANPREIVISFAGTGGDGDWSHGNIPLALGRLPDQLRQAADYYLQVKASAPTGSSITFTGHSLGGGLASLMAVMFGEKAVTFDQAPFRNSALTYTVTDPVSGSTIRSVAQDLLDYLRGQTANGQPKYGTARLQGLIDYVAALQNAAPDVLPNEGSVTNINVDGEILTVLPGFQRIGAQSNIPQQNNMQIPALREIELHSQALLTAFLQSDPNAATNTDASAKTFNRVTFKLPELLKMIFDKNLFAFDPNNKDNPQRNFLEHIVRHQAGMGSSLPADDMVKRFTSDLWKLAQEGGLTINDGYAGNAEVRNISKALAAFAMQFYYEDTANANDSKKHLFTDLAATGEGSSGIRFAIGDVSQKIAAAIAEMDAGGEVVKLDAKKDGKFILKGYEFFDQYLNTGRVEGMAASGIFSNEELGQIKAFLPYMRDWYVQAGAGGMTATDTQNRGAFMLGGNGSDTLTGGTANDLLVGNAGSDLLNGGEGNDVLLGGSGQDILKGGKGVDLLLGGGGSDTLDGGAGNDLLRGGDGNDTYTFTGDYGIDIVTDSDGSGSLQVDGQTLGGGSKILENVYKDSASGQAFVKLNGGKTLVALKESTKSRILVNDWPAAGTLGIVLQDSTTTVPTVTLMGDFKKAIDNHNTPEITDDTYVMDGENYAKDGAEANALDQISGTTGNDVIDGGGGDDALSGKAGNDYILGGIGNDHIQGGLGADTIFGGDGHDKIFGSSDKAHYNPTRVDFERPVNDYFNPQGTGFNWTAGYFITSANGVPRAFSNAPRNRLDGDQGNLIDGGIGNDFIAAGTGSDIVHGGADNDLVYGMDQGDILFGDGGNDLIYGDGNQPDGVSVVWTLPENHGNDVIDGGKGNDYLIGQGGDDIVFGGEGKDSIWGDDDPVSQWANSKGDDYLFGGEDEDQIFGGAGKDYLEGGTGNDTIWGEVGDDVYFYNAGDGVDTIHDNEREKNILRFGAGVDASTIKLRLGSLMLDMGNGDAIHIEDFNQNDVFNSSSIVSFEFADGSTLTDKELLARGFDLDGTDGDDSIAGTNTTDRIRGFAGNDALIGRAGSDQLLGGTGNDSLFGDADDVALTDQGDDYLDGEAGDDYLRGYAGNDTLMGGIGTDRLFAEAGDDVLDGGADDDLLYGGDGNDVLAGGVGTDFLQGGAGNDTYLYRIGDGTDHITDASIASGTPGGSLSLNTIKFGAGIAPSDIKLDFFLGKLKLVIGSDPNDAIYIDGFDPNDALATKSTPAINRFQFDDGTEITYTQLINQGFDLSGSADNNVINGTNVTDRIAGGAGGDLLIGGIGDDVLSGGDGIDIYRFSANFGSDVVIDNASENSILRFDFGLNPESFSAARIGDDLHLSLNASLGSVLIKDYFVAEQSNWQVDFEGQQSTPLSEIFSGAMSRSALGKLWTETRNQVISSRLESELQGQSYFSYELGKTLQYPSINLGNLAFERTLSNIGAFQKITDLSTTTLATLDGKVLSQTDSVNESSNFQGWLYGDSASRYIVKYEVRRNQSNDLLIENNAVGGIDQTTGTAIANISLGDRQTNFQSSHWSYSDLVRNEQGEAVGQKLTQYWRDTYQVYGFVSSFDDDLTGWTSQENSVLGNRMAVRYSLSTQHLSLVDEIVAGDADNEIHANSWATELVDGGAGSDTIVSEGGATQVDLLYGNTGNDIIRGNGAILVGGEGNDQLYGGQLSDRYVFLDAAESGADLIQDAGSSLDDYKSWFYGQQGISNYRELSPVEHWAIWPGDGGPTFYSRPEMDAWFAARYPEWSVAEAIASGDLVHFPALPPMLIGNSRDYALKADTGIGAQDIVVLPEALKLADLSFSWGEHDDGDGQLRLTLDVSWNGALHARIVMPNANDPIGFGVEGFKFGKGLFMPMSQILQFAPAMPNLGDGTQIGNAQSDQLTAGNSAEVLFGMAGNDTLVGGAGNDTLAGGEGNDQLMGGQGNDVYVVHYSSDQDLLQDSGGVDTLQFAYDVKPEEVSVRRVGNDLVLSHSVRGNKITMVNWLLDTQQRIEQVRFLDGTGWDTNVLIAKADAYGAIVGTDGNDSLSADEYDNTLFGLRGNDFLNGGAGDDVYVFARGDGQDVIDQSGAVVGDRDIVRFSSGISPQDVTVLANSYDLVLRIKGSTDSLTLSDWLKGESTRVAAVEFADQTVWDQGALELALQNPPSDNEIIGTEDNDPWLYGTEAGDAMYGLGGDDELEGMGGNDELHGGLGEDYLIGGPGDDVYIFQRGDGYDLVSDEDSLSEDIDQVRFGQGISPDDVSVVADGDNLVLTIAGSEDRIDLLRWRHPVGAQVASVAFSDGTVWDTAELEERAGIGKTLIGGAGNDVLTGSQKDDVLLGGSGDDILIGGLGDDFLIGGAGADTYVFNLGDGQDWIEEFHPENLAGSNSENVIRFGAGIAPSELTIRLEDGDLYFRILSSGDSIGYGGRLENAPRLEFADGQVISPSEVKAAIVNLSGDDGDNWLVGTSGNDLLQGGGGNDVIVGMGGDDHMVGGAGDDWFHQNGGNDLLEGGMGGDAYILTRTSGRDVIVELSGDDSRDWLGIDRSILPEDVYYTRFAGDGDDLLISVNGSSSSLLVRDWFATTPSRLEYFSWSATDSYWESPDIESAVWGSNASDSEPPNINDAPTGTVTVTGTATQNQRLTADNTLGDLDGLGAIGYQWQSSANGTTWNDIAGVTSTSFTLTASQVGQQMRVVASYVDGRGTAESVASGASDVVLNVNDAPTGTVTVTGAATQNQTLSAGNTLGDLDGLGTIGYQWQSSANGAIWNDIAGATSTSFTLTESQVGQQMRVVASYVDGHGTAESVASGATDAVLNVNDAPVLSMTPNSQSATEGVAFTYVLPNGTFADPDVGDTLAYTAKQANGNALPAWLTFNGTTRTFTGTAGQADIGLMQIVVTATDAGGLSCSTNFQMNIAAHVPVSLIGTTGADTLYGFSGADTLDGGPGADTLIGRGGDDTYFVDNTADVVTEAANEGADTVKSSVTYTLSTNVENLTLTGTATINGTGNTLNNVLTGNSAANTLTGGAGNDTLDGGAGNDTMVGGLGDDTYLVDSASDVVTENASEGTDTVRSSVTLTLANNVENLLLSGTTAINGTGNTLNNVITGNSAANTLSGGTGADTMIGGAGDDTYVVDNTGDIVTENAIEGTDLVQSGVTYTLSANVENLTLSGTTAINGTGNALDNVLTGNTAVNTLTGGAGNDTLNGGAGADTMIGGAGNDSYVVDNASDVVTELLSEGTDLVQSSVTTTLSANVENLTLTGTTAINGTGNALDNILIGNSTNNTLTGGDGNDTIDGGTGNDRMVGGLGDDTYVVNVSTDVVTEAANAGNDTIQSAVTLTLTTNVENLALTGTTAINGTGNTLSNLVRGNTAINKLNGGTGIFF
ncbi:hypothetical protein AT959_18835, partial [Dechloromonas denitrificans]